MDEEELRHWFASLKEELETAYIRNTKAWEQSGYYGSEELWTAARKPVADCIESSGSFLDIGCANGYLLECTLKWTSEKNLEITPYGLDISEKLIEMAKNTPVIFTQGMAGTGRILSGSIMYVPNWFMSRNTCRNSTLTGY